MSDLDFSKAILVAIGMIGFCKSIKITAMINQVMADIRPYAMMYEEVSNASQLSFSLASPFSSVANCSHHPLHDHDHGYDHDQDIDHDHYHV